jgi:flagella basal body P-ring formation protein FlgA
LLFTIHYSLFIAFGASSDIGDALKEYIKGNYPWAEVDMGDLKFSDGPPQGIPQKILVEKGPPGRTVFSLEYKNGRRITATANVKAYDKIVVSRKGFKKGYCLQEDDVYTTLLEIGRIPKEAIRDVTGVAGKTLTRSIIANMPIAESMVTEKPQVKKGQRVLIVAESSGFSITAFGEMKESGYVGNYVKAVNLASKKAVTGMLVNENTIKVDF